MERYENFKEINMRRANEEANKNLITSLSILFVVLMFIIGAIIGYRMKFEYVPISGVSMQDTINQNPKAVTVTKADGTTETRLLQDGAIIEHTQNPERNDVVVIKIPGRKDTIIKRVIALPGDKVTIRKLNVADDATQDLQYRVIIIPKGKVSPQALEEEHVKSYQEWSGQESQEDNGVYYDASFYNTFLNGGQVSEGKGVSLEGDTLFYTVPEDNFFYLGDNRAKSADARVNGAAKLSQIQGVVRVIVHDAQTAQEKGLLGLTVFSNAVSYIFNQFSEFFAWKG